MSFTAEIHTVPVAVSFFPSRNPTFSFLLQLGGSPIEDEAIMQQRIKLIEGNAIDRMGIDRILSVRHLRRLRCGIVQAGTSSDNEYANELDVAISERLRESFDAREIIKVVKPIYHLAEAMIKAQNSIQDLPWCLPS